MSGEIDRQLPVTVLRLVGTLRPRGVPLVRGLLLKCLAECPAGVVVDLSSFAVSQPLLLTVFPAVLDRAAAWPAVPVVLAAPDEPTATALRRSPALAIVPVCPTVDDAIDAAGRGAPLGRLRLYLRPTADAPAEARKFVRDACAAWDLEAITDEATVVVSELVDNASRHARTEFVLTLFYRGTYLHVAVHDRAPEPARPRRSEQLDHPSAVPGKGLRLVDAFATAWGTLPAPDGKTTWATLGVS